MTNDYGETKSSTLKTDESYVPTDNVRINEEGFAHFYVDGVSWEMEEFVALAKAAISGEIVVAIELDGDCEASILVVRARQGSVEKRRIRVAIDATGEPEVDAGGGWETVWPPTMPKTTEGIAAAHAAGFPGDYAAALAASEWLASN